MSYIIQDNTRTCLHIESSRFEYVELIVRGPAAAAAVSLYKKSSLVQLKS